MPVRSAVRLGQISCMPVGHPHTRAREIGHKVGRAGTTAAKTLARMWEVHKHAYKREAPREPSRDWEARRVRPIASGNGRAAERGSSFGHTTHHAEVPMLDHRKRVGELVPETHEDHGIEGVVHGHVPAIEADPNASSTVSAHRSDTHLFTGVFERGLSSS